MTPTEATYELHVFGGRWPAGMFEDQDATVVDVPAPTELECMYCLENFEEGDRGTIQSNGFAQHRECGLRSVMGGIGHHVDHNFYCHGELGPDAGLSKRRSALLVWDVLVERRAVTREWLERQR